MTDVTRVFCLAHIALALICFAILSTGFSTTAVILAAINAAMAVFWWRA